MPQHFIRSSIHFIAIICIALLYLIFTSRSLPSFSITQEELQNFKTIFLSIAFEAIPFILIGVFVSSILQVFVPDKWIHKLLPKSPIAGVVVGALLGIVFPLCECGMVPVVRKLVQKGMPLYIGIVYILAGPIINPVVYTSTAMAFRHMPELIWWRMILAFIVAVLIGLFLHRMVRMNVLKEQSEDSQNKHAEDHNHQHNRLSDLFSHISDEFFIMGKYLLIGCLITGAFQVFVSREWLISQGEGMGSHLFMASFAYLLSICSNSDAFIASSFSGTFSAGSLLTFMVFGPMLDLKNTFVLLSVFRAKFVLLLSAAVLILVLTGSIVIEHIWL